MLSADRNADTHSHSRRAPGEFTVHVDLISLGGGQVRRRYGTMTFDGQTHNAFGGPGVSATDLTYQGTVCGPNIKGDGH